MTTVAADGGGELSLVVVNADAEGDELLVNRRVIPERGRQQDAVFDPVRSTHEGTIRDREVEIEVRLERAGSRFARLSSTVPAAESDEGA